MSDRRCESLLDKQVLQGFGSGNGPTFTESPLSPSAWNEYNDTINCFAKNLPSLYCSLFNLGRSLAEVVYPRPSAFDEKSGEHPAFDAVSLQGQLSPELSRLMREIRSESDLLIGMPQRLKGVNPYREACKLHKAILSHLGLEKSGSVFSDDERIANGTCLPSMLTSTDNTTLSVVPLAPEEDVETLLALKKRLDPKSEGVAIFIWR